MRQKLLVLLLALPMLLVGGCRSLDPAGPYGGDKVLYSADLTISTSYDVIHTMVSWEKQNRAALSAIPQVREFADLMRSNYPTYHRAAMSARMVYANSKTKPNQTALALTLDVLREAVRQANQWLASSTNVPSPLEATR